MMDGDRQSRKKRKSTSKEKSPEMRHLEARSSENENRYWEYRRSHVQKKGFVCKECWKVFTHGSHFVQHQKSHTGQSTHTCHECGKHFNKKFNLDRHMATHNKQVKATVRARPVNMRKKRQLP